MSPLEQRTRTVHVAGVQEAFTGLECAAERRNLLVKPRVSAHLPVGAHVRAARKEEMAPSSSRLEVPWFNAANGRWKRAA